jgi:hypothetical protein
MAIAYTKTSIMAVQNFSIAVGTYLSLSKLGTGRGRCELPPIYRILHTSNFNMAMALLHHIRLLNGLTNFCL